MIAQKNASFEFRANGVARYRLLPVLCVACMLAWSFPVLLSASPINYGDFIGSTVTYLQVTEDANSVGDVPPLFGAPTVSGDSLDFTPVGFSAASSGANGVDITDGNLAFSIQAHPNYIIDTVQFSEAGDTTLAGFGTDATLTSVTCELFVDILEVDGVGINAINLQDQMVFTPSNGDYKLGSDGGGGPLYQTDWHGSLNIDITQALIDNGIPFTFGATRITFNLDNTLVALSEDGTESLIAKKDTDGLTISVNIPEPATWGLAMLGMIPFFLARRWRRG